MTSRQNISQNFLSAIKTKTMSFATALKEIKTQTKNGCISLPVAQLLTLYQIGPHRVLYSKDMIRSIAKVTGAFLSDFLVEQNLIQEINIIKEVERIFLYLPAIEHENISVLNMVVQDANLRVQGKLLIEEALFQNKFKAAQWLYENGARLDIKEDGYSILHNLIIENHVLGMEWILNKEPKHANISGCLYSTLMTAIDFNRVEAFDLLLNFGADINAIDPTGSYVAHYAVESPNNYFLSSLLKVYSVDYFGHDINYYVTNETDHTIVSLIRSVFSIMDMTK
ncbi:hypothetical protein O9G_001185 [Rozella allomycis CSF55]|uniref:Uncharacterized protein n=1 Tax=Rozella allomycis (strain CSF55) TaxID=988480 RepID=A0A075ASF7_ROZAC|nr:hypothetical protein O9G_001185 [Rozella allomycis CSF55]|eukprot:EPZ33216.1 hypothetical protein O9G_001185 [Rozella allomycis CSF55]